MKDATILSEAEALRCIIMHRHICKVKVFGSREERVFITSLLQSSAHTTAMKDTMFNYCNQMQLKGMHFVVLAVLNTTNVSSISAPEFDGPIKSTGDNSFV